MRAIILLLLIANLTVAGLGLSGAFDSRDRRGHRFDAEVPGFRGRLLELADDVNVQDPFPLLPATGQCFLARGFAEPGDALNAARRWLALERAVTPMRRSIPGEVTGVQVLTLPSRSRDERVRLQQALEQLGFTAHLVAGGPYADRVSLGVFKAPHEAETLLERLRSSGFEAELIELRDHEYDEVVAGPIADAPSGDSVPGVVIETLPCSAIAARYDRF